jgi:hypothetical protein
VTVDGAGSAFQSKENIPVSAELKFSKENNNVEFAVVQHLQINLPLV